MKINNYISKKKYFKGGILFFILLLSSSLCSADTEQIAKKKLSWSSREIYNTIQDLYWEKHIKFSDAFCYIDAFRHITTPTKYLEYMSANKKTRSEYDAKINDYYLNTKMLNKKEKQIYNQFTELDREVHIACNKFMAENNDWANYKYSYNDWSSKEIELIRQQLSFYEDFVGDEEKMFCLIDILREELDFKDVATIETSKTYHDKTILNQEVISTFNVKFEDRCTNKKK